MCLNPVQSTVLTQGTLMLFLRHEQDSYPGPNLSKETNTTLLFLKSPRVLVWSCWWLSRHPWTGAVPLVVPLWHLWSAVLLRYSFCNASAFTIQRISWSPFFYSWAFSQFRHCQSCLTLKTPSLLQASVRTGSSLESYYILYSVWHRWSCWTRHTISGLSSLSWEKLSRKAWVGVHSQGRRKVIPCWWRPWMFCPLATYIFMQKV